MARNPGADLFHATSGTQPASTVPARRLSPGASLFHGVEPAPRPKAAKKAAKKKGGGGFLGTLKHIGTQGPADLYHDAINAPAGIVSYAGALGRAADQPFAKLDVKLGFASEAEKKRARGRGVSDFKTLNREIGKATVETAKHPLRHPGDTLLLALPAASGVARVARAGTIAKEAGLAAGAKELAHPKYGERSVSVGDLTVHPETSRSALGYVAQKGLDKAIQSPKSGRVGKALTERKVGKVITAEQRVAENKAKALPATLLALGRKLDLGQQKALQVVAEQAPLRGRITAASARVVGAKGEKNRSRHQEELDLLHQAASHIDDSGPVPTFTGENAVRLQRVYSVMEKVAGNRENLLKSLDLLTEESIARRKTEAGRVALGAHYNEPTPAKLGQSDALDRARAREERLQGLYDRSAARRDKEATKLIANLTRREEKIAARERAREAAKPAAATTVASARPTASGAAARQYGLRAQADDLMEQANRQLADLEAQGMAPSGDAAAKRAQAEAFRAQSRLRDQATDLREEATRLEKEVVRERLSGHTAAPTAKPSRLEVIPPKPLSAKESQAIAETGKGIKAAADQIVAEAHAKAAPEVKPPKWATEDAATIARQRAELDRLEKAGADPNNPAYQTVLEGPNWGQRPTLREDAHAYLDSLDKAKAKKLKAYVTREQKKAAAKAEVAATAHLPADPRLSRLGELEKIHNRQLDKIANMLYGPVGKIESQQRSAQRGMARKQQSGVNKAGRPSGAAGTNKARMVKTATEQRRIDAEAWAIENIAKLPPGHELRVAWEKRTNEMDALAKELAPNPEDVFGSGPAKFAEPKKEELHPSLEEHAGGQTRLTTAGEQASLLPREDATIPTKAAETPSALDEAVAAKAAAKAELPHVEFDAALWTEGARVQRGGRTVAKLGPDMTWTIWRDTRPGFEAKAARGDVGISMENAVKKLGADRDLVDAMNDAERMMARSRNRDKIPTEPKAAPLPASATSQPYSKPVVHITPAKKREPAVAPIQIGGRVLAPGKVLTPPGAGRTETLGAALSIAKTERQQIEAAVLKKIQQTGIVGQEQFEAGKGAIRIPDVATRRGTKQLQRAAKVGGQGTIGFLNAPGSVTHRYTGALREGAVRRQKTTELVAESGLEAAKYEGLLHIHQMVRRAAQPAPSHPSDIAVRLDIRTERPRKGQPAPKGLGKGEKLPFEVQRFRDDPEEFFNVQSVAEKSAKFESLRQRLFIDPRKLDPAARADFAKLEAEGKIGWVPRRMLGDLAKNSAPLASVTGSKTVGVFDAINNASRFAILYLKPAYAVPNILGNAALNIVQQGFAAPGNLKYAARMNQILGEEMTATIDALMEEGFAKSISAHATGPMARVVDKAANTWSKIVDTPFRRSSFLHEAKRAGYRTPAQLERLLTDKRHDEALTQVTMKANREIIDYSNLSPVEREVVRRLIFFYPWVKGSTVYSARMLREHPVKSAAIGQLGVEGRKEATRDLGVLPPYLEGSFKVGNRIVNPNAAAILQTPAELAGSITGLLTGDTNQARRASEFFTPALALALSELQRRDWRGIPYPEGTNAAKIAQDSLVGSLPQVRVVKQIRAARRGEGKGDLYPPSLESALAGFAVGGVYPRKYNKTRLRYLEAQSAKRKRNG